MTCKMKISDENTVLVDRDDFERVARYNWYLHTGYPARNGSRKGETRNKTIFLHHFICRTNQIVDHINGDKLDNRKSNLRIATHQENCFNRPANFNKKSSKYKGVFWSNEKQLWLSIIKINGVPRHLGYFDTEENAAIAYNENAKQLFGKFAYLNGVPGNKNWWENRVFIKPNSTGFRGVTSHPQGKWQARITVEGKRISLGYFDSPKEAALAYNRAAITYHKERALLNQI